MEQFTIFPQIRLVILECLNLLAFFITRDHFYYCVKDGRGRYPNDLNFHVKTGNSSFQWYCHSWKWKGINRTTDFAHLENNFLSATSNLIKMEDPILQTNNGAAFSIIMNKLFSKAYSEQTYFLSPCQNGTSFSPSFFSTVWNNFSPLYNGTNEFSFFPTMWKWNKLFSLLQTLFSQYELYLSDSHCFSIPIVNGGQLLFLHYYSQWGALFKC